MSYNNNSRPSTPSGGVLPPPPATASRRRLTNRTPSQESSPSPVPLLDVNPENLPQASAGVTSEELLRDERPRKPGLMKAHSLYNNDSGPIVPSTQVAANRMSLPTDESSHFLSGFHPDLEGLDFSKVTQSGTFASGSSLSESKSKTSSMYPDISHAFKQLDQDTHKSGGVDFTAYSYDKSHNPFTVQPTPPLLPPQRLPPPGNQPPSQQPPPPPTYGWNLALFSNNSFLSSSSSTNQQPSLSPSTSFNQLSHAALRNASTSSPSFNQTTAQAQPNFADNPFTPNIGSIHTPTAQNSPWPDTTGLATTSLGFDSDPFNNFNSIRNVPSSQFKQSMPFVPNITLQCPSTSGSLPVWARRDASASPTDNAMTPDHPMAMAGFDTPISRPNDAGLNEDGDLINLGTALPEHEYLSLDSFDPLYHRARRESVCHSGISSRDDTSSQFSFGDAFPNAFDSQRGGGGGGRDNQGRQSGGPVVAETKLHSEEEEEGEDSVWTTPPSSLLPDSGLPPSKPPPGTIGFEAFFDFDSHGASKFGSSEEEFLRQPAVAVPTVTASIGYDHLHADSTRKDSKPERPPPPWIPPKGKHYEPLRKRTFIDPESESFCQMVADLKKQYPSTDQRHNQGYLTNQIHECHIGSIQLKLVVHTELAEEPVAFTCDTNALVEHVISHVLYTARPANTQPDTDLFILKVYDKMEYLANDLPLAKFEYTHSCLKLGKDLTLELVTCEQVTRPFIKTSDDDDQMLYFPKEYINADGTAISMANLTILLDTFYHQVDSFLRLAHQEEDSHSASSSVTLRCKGVEQAVKAICVNLAKVETTDITKALTRLHDTVTELNSPSIKSQGLFQDSTDEDTQKAIGVAVRCSMLEDVDECCQQLVSAVKSLIRMYCRTFLTNFFIGSSIEIPHDHLEVMHVRDNFLVCMASAHRIPSLWHGKFEEYKLVCSLYFGTKKLATDVTTTSKPLTSNLCDTIVWDEWLQFEDTYLCNLPRETRLCVMLCGSRAPTYGDKGDKSSKGDNQGHKRLVTYTLCAAAIQLFNEKGYLHQGPQLVPLMMGASSDPIMPSCKTLLPDSILLQVNLPDFERTIFYPVPLNAEVAAKSFDQLVPGVQSLVNAVIEKESCSTFLAEEYEIVWQYRHYLMDHPSLLPRILQAAKTWDWASLAEIYALLKHWKALHPMQAFELILPEFPDRRVREFAADSLNRIPTDDLIHFLPQMIQALKFETYHNSPMAKLLLEQACKSPRFAHQFFWLLKGVASQEVTFKRRYELMFVALASVAGDSLYQEFKKQEHLVKIVTTLAEKVKTAKDKETTLRRELQSLHDVLESHGRVLLPFNPSLEVASLDLKSCSYFTSFTFPLKLVFKNSNPKADSHYVMFKVGDDLRQDMLTLQMIGIMDSLWLQQGLDLKMVTFSCLATGPKKGILELVTESDTLRKIQVSCGLTGSFKDRPIKEWLQKHNPTELEYKKAVENFSHSCAGYCVATYVLGICDRHNDNIMVKQSGHMFHIDFSKFLGDAQMFGNFKRDRVPFVLTSDMAYVINDGAKQGDRFQHFVDLCCQAFNILRRHADLFRSLFILMARSGIPNVTERAVHYVQNALLPGQTDAQATATFTRMIQESMKSVFTQFNFFIHNLAQMKFSSHQEGALLSFEPKAYSEDTDGRISRVELHGCQKRYTPEKHYIYIVKIERENQKVPTYVFRHFSEFVEFRDKLNEMFTLVTWPNFSTRVVIGRSNIRSVAESRKEEIANFLKYLWVLADEISKCELVYTFFHPLLRDEQEAEKSSLNTIKLKEPLRPQPIAGANHSGIQGEIKLSVEYKRDALQVMVMHVRGLAEIPELPSPYVKTYLLPDPDKLTKLKTKTVKNTSHPTYNELLQYEVPMLEVTLRHLQVTVWDRDMLKENNLLGAVYIKLRDLDLATDTVAWYTLGPIQPM